MEKYSFFDDYAHSCKSVTRLIKTRWETYIVFKFMSCDPKKGVAVL